jgi:serine/threonine protein kinase
MTAHQLTPFGRYHLLDRINVGGMAEVFRAKSFGVEGFEKLLAVKRIMPDIGREADFARMFIDEAKIGAQLTHANIAQVFDLGAVDGLLFIAMEYIHGKDLRAILERLRNAGERIPQGVACAIISQACDALAFAHKKRAEDGTPLGIVHRDVSPQNLLISYEGDLKVIDFGIARAAKRDVRTQTGVMKGKFGYMSPEQVRGKGVDARSDQFSLGIVFYELLTGERLFVGENELSTLEKIRDAVVVPPTEVYPGTALELERIVLKMLAASPEERYETLLHVKDDIQTYLLLNDCNVVRQDVAVLVGRLFAPEIEKETAELEEWNQIAPPGKNGGSATNPSARNKDATNPLRGSGDWAAIRSPDETTKSQRRPALGGTALANAPKDGVTVATPPFRWYLWLLAGLLLAGIGAAAVLLLKHFA